MKATAIKIGPSDWKLHWKELLLVSTLILAAPFLQGGINPLSAEAETEFLATPASRPAAYRVYRSEPTDVSAQILHGPMQTREANRTSSSREIQSVQEPYQTR